MTEKGRISAILDGGRKVTVIPSFSGDVVSHELVVPFFLIDCLTIQMEVAYCSFPDNTGVVLARMDGEWNHKIEGDLEMTGMLRGAVVTEGGVRLGTHTHTDSMGGTTSVPK